MTFDPRSLTPRLTVPEDKPDAPDPSDFFVWATRAWGNSRVHAFDADLWRTTVTGGEILSLCGEPWSRQQMTRTTTTDLCEECIRTVQRLAPTPDYTVLLGSDEEACPSPTISVICGSTRQREDFERLNAMLTLEERIVLSVGLFGHEAGLDMSGPVKARLDELHLRKIDLADEAHFITKADGTLGESTTREYDYAKAHGKTIVVHDLSSVGANPYELGMGHHLGGYLDPNSSRYLDSAFDDSVTTDDPTPGDVAPVIPDSAQVRDMSEEQAREAGLIQDVVPEPEGEQPIRHEGRLMSGVITCTCGDFESQHWAIAADAYPEFEAHLRTMAEEAAMAKYNEARVSSGGEPIWPLMMEDVVKAAIDTIIPRQEPTDG